jgi:ubiquinone/menaquinone biosynthesis C-methylase UbiE
MVRMTTSSPSASDPQAFTGTAEYYAAGRPEYSAQLAETMARELSLDGAGQLLEVGCGPGVLVLPLARLFGQVTALDPEPGMLAAGQRRCQQAGVANVRWVQGVAEHIATLNPAS